MIGPLGSHLQAVHHRPDIKNVIEISSGFNHWACVTSDGSIYRFKYNKGIRDKSSSEKVITSKLFLEGRNQFVKIACGRSFLLVFMNDELRYVSHWNATIENSKVLVRLAHNTILKLYCASSFYWILFKNGKLGCGTLDSTFEVLVDSSNIKKIIPGMDEDFILLDDGSFYHISNTLTDYIITKVQNNILDLAISGSKCLTVDCNGHLSINSTKSISVTEEQWIREQIPVTQIYSNRWAGFYIIRDITNKFWLCGKSINPSLDPEEFPITELPNDFITILLPFCKAKSAKK